MDDIKKEIDIEHEFSSQLQIEFLRLRVQLHNLKEFLVFGRYDFLPEAEIWINWTVNARAWLWHIFLILLPSDSIFEDLSKALHGISLHLTASLFYKFFTFQLPYFWVDYIPFLVLLSFSNSLTMTPAASWKVFLSLKFFYKSLFSFSCFFYSTNWFFLCELNQIWNLIYLAIFF